MNNIQQIRAAFPILSQSVNGRELVYLDNAATTQKPTPVIERVHAYYERENSNIHRGIHHLSEQAETAYEAARQSVASFIGGCALNEIVFTSGTTASINLVAHSFGTRFLKPGDQVLVSQMEHHSNLLPWQVLCERSGAQLRTIPLKENGTLDMNAYRRALGERTRLVAITHVSNVLGTVNPIREITESAHSADAAVLVDGAQAVPHLDVNVLDLDCDFYAFSGHKMYAHMGIGVLYGKEKWLEQMPPFLTGGGMVNRVTFEESTYADLPHKFEAGTPNVAGVLSLDAAIAYIHEASAA